jgi:hypothetical protein
MLEVAKVNKAPHVRAVGTKVPRCYAMIYVRVLTCIIVHKLEIFIILNYLYKSIIILSRNITDFDISFPIYCMHLTIYPSKVPVQLTVYNV